VTPALTKVGGGFAPTKSTSTFGMITSLCSSAEDPEKKNNINIRLDLQKNSKNSNFEYKKKNTYDDNNLKKTYLRLQNERPYLAFLLL
jgi:hypothetical protein